MVLLANGALSTLGNEVFEIRKQLVENDCVEAWILPCPVFDVSTIKNIQHDQSAMRGASYVLL